MKKIKDIGLAKIFEYSLMLAKMIDEDGYRPDHVLYVERVGLFPGHEIAKYFGCSISGIKSSRSGTSIKSKAKILLRYLPKPMTHLLRNIEIKSNFHGIKKERNVYIESEFPEKGKKILIVDDAVDTGFSLNAALNYLETNGYLRSLIKTAVLTTTQKSPVCRPDITLFHQIDFSFPWSYDSMEYNKSWKLYEHLKNTVP